MFSGASLPDGTSIKGGGHDVEGKDERDKREVKLRLYRLGKELVTRLVMEVIWGRGPDQGSFPFV